MEQIRTLTETGIQEQDGKQKQYRKKKYKKNGKHENTDPDISHFLAFLADVLLSYVPVQYGCNKNPTTY